MRFCSRFCVLLVASSLPVRPKTMRGTRYSPAGEHNNHLGRSWWRPEHSLRRLGRRAAPGATVYQELPAFCRVAPKFAPRKIRTSKSKCGCPLQDGMENIRGRATAALPERLITGLWPALWAEDMPAPAPIPVTSGDATDASWAPGHPEKIIDFGYRGIHEMSEKAKAVITAFYGNAPRHSYFSSCSDGGREALMEAQRFPMTMTELLPGRPPTSGPIWLREPPGTIRLYWQIRQVISLRPSYPQSAPRRLLPATPRTDWPTK